MNNMRPPGERTLFIVSRTPSSSTQARPVERNRPWRFADHIVVLAAVIFLVVVGISAYLCLGSTRERTEDFILIFLPISCLLMGVAFGACFRS